jgi:hypothetical protein
MEAGTSSWPLAERAAPWLHRTGDEARAWALHLRTHGPLPGPAAAFAVRITAARDGTVAFDPRVRLFPHRTGITPPAGTPPRPDDDVLVMLVDDERGDRELHRLAAAGTLTPVRRLPAWAPDEPVWCDDPGDGTPGWVGRWWAEPEALAPPETPEILAFARALARAWAALGAHGVVTVAVAHDGSGALDGGCWLGEVLDAVAGTADDPYPGGTATLRGLLGALDPARELALHLDDPWSAARTGIYRLPLEPDAPGRAAADPVRWRLGDAPLPTPLGWELRGALNALTRLRGEVRKGAAVTLARRCLEEGYPALVPTILRAAPRWSPPDEAAVRLLLRAYALEGHGGERIGAAYRALRETRRRLEGPAAEPEEATQALLRELLTAWRWGSGAEPPPGAPPVTADPDDPAWREPSADSRRLLAAHVDAFLGGHARPRHDDDPGWVR